MSKLVCFREHLGITDKNDAGGMSVEDPVSSDFYKGVWLKQASINTDVYDKVNQFQTVEIFCDYALNRSKELFIRMYFASVCLTLNCVPVIMYGDHTT